MHTKIFVEKTCAQPQHKNGYTGQFRS